MFPGAYLCKYLYGCVVIACQLTTLYYSAGGEEVYEVRM